MDAMDLMDELQSLLYIPSILSKQSIRYRVFSSLWGGGRASGIPLCGR